MSVSAVTWVATRVPDEELRRVPALATALGLTVLSSGPDQVLLSTPRGDIVEYCAPGHPVPDYLFAGGPVVTGFAVDDLEAAAGALESAGFVALAPAVAAGGVTFQHFSGPGEPVIALIAVPPDPEI